jgi:hypothetical protein
MLDKSQIIATVCGLLRTGDIAEAASVARREYPFINQVPAGRDYTEREAMRIFVRDGFIDRYSGQPLLFQGVLRLLSRLFIGTGR